MGEAALVSFDARIARGDLGEGHWRLLRGMAGDAAAAEFVLVVGSPVAVDAVQAGVTVGEREAGFAQVIEAGSLPPGRRMTAAAIGAARTVVYVVDCMAGFFAKGAS